MTFSRSTDYSAIRELLMDPRAQRRMTGEAVRFVGVGPGADLEYVTATEGSKLVAVFVVLKEIEVHFCFSPESWGRTIEISKEFLKWAWENLNSSVLIGPVPTRNRLALKLAKRAGFKESHYSDRDDLTYVYCERPAA